MKRHLPWKFVPGGNCESKNHCIYERSKERLHISKRKLNEIYHLSIVRLAPIDVPAAAKVYCESGLLSKVDDFF
jgi:hypothetical protein